MQIRIYVPNIYSKFNDLVGQFINVQSIWSIFVFVVVLFLLGILQK